MKRKKKNSSANRGKQARIELIGITPEDKQPEMAVYAVNRSFKPIEVSAVDSKGRFSLSQKALDKADLVVFGPKVKDLAGVKKDTLSIYRVSQFKQILTTKAIFEFPRVDWFKWFLTKYCVSGSVTHCRPWPWFITKLLQKADITLEKLITPVAAPLDPTKEKPVAAISDVIIDKPLKPFFPRRYWCNKVCDGLVEVYRRTCCCYPWIIYDPRLPELIEELERLIPKWPPIPGPDPPPIDELSFFKSGTLDERIINARRDLHAIRTLPPQELPAYINARPYLCCCWCCCCGSPTKVAQGFIRHDGQFHICWFDWPRLMLINCHDEYAFVVKQNFNGNTVTIYDGVAANQWFHYGDHADLVSYHPQAQSCRRNDFPGEDDGTAFALLQNIGSTDSYDLKTPDATGWDRVAAPAYNDGLAKPAPNPAAAEGKELDRNWGGTLNLYYFFSEPMRTIGARYYRISVVAADGNGNPTGPRTCLTAPSWKYFEAVGSQIYVKRTPLGPNSVGGQDNLYLIPYDYDRVWLSSQFHAFLDTTTFANGRFLLTLEIFNGAGKLIRPTGTPNPGGSEQANFTYRRWFQEIGPTAAVPFAGLTHMFWWDNRRAGAKIVGLRVGNEEHTEECQFLTASGESKLSADYRAYHPNPMFLLNHRLWWRRGLGGPTGNLTDPHPNPESVGIPPNPPHQSGTNTFAQMLADLTNPKCTFSLNLRSYVKTFNGNSTLHNLDALDQASFALEIPQPT